MGLRTRSRVLKGKKIFACNNYGSQTTMGQIPIELMVGEGKLRTGGGKVMDNEGMSDSGGGRETGQIKSNCGTQSGRSHQGGCGLCSLRSAPPPQRPVPSDPCSTSGWSPASISAVLSQTCRLSSVAGTSGTSFSGLQSFLPAWNPCWTGEPEPPSM